MLKNRLKILILLIIIFILTVFLFACFDTIAELKILIQRSDYILKTIQKTFIDPQHYTELFSFSPPEAVSLLNNPSLPQETRKELLETFRIIQQSVAYQLQNYPFLEDSGFYSPYNGLVNQPNVPNTRLPITKIFRIAGHSKSIFLVYEPAAAKEELMFVQTWVTEVLKLCSTEVPAAKNWFIWIKDIIITPLKALDPKLTKPTQSDWLEQIRNIPRQLDGFKDLQPNKQQTISQEEFDLKFEQLKLQFEKMRSRDQYEQLKLQYEELRRVGGGSEKKN